MRRLRSSLVCSFAPSLALILGPVLAGCSSDASTSPPANQTDAGQSYDQSVDHADTGEEAAPDAAPDAGGQDTALDSPLDTAPDATPVEPPPPCDKCMADAPLHPASPWPKFRGNLEQTARSTVKPSLTGGSLWTLASGKGVFSSPVVGPDGTVYIGSADRTFYALSHDGKVKWQLLTGEIIDSSALLDDKGRVYFGSGDGKLRALDAATGDPLWTFQAEDPSVNKAFINWFEGNVAIGTDGTLYVPNDNFSVYGVVRDSGDLKWKWLMNDQTWSLPAVSLTTGNLFLGNNYLAGSWLLGLFWKNTFALHPDGTMIWRDGVNASIAASPMLDPAGRMFVGAFDGYLRAYNQSNGKLLWSWGTNDHLYSSPSRLSDGTVIQPSTDGTVYALDPASGALLWAFDTREPIRSSAAVDGEDHIYFGGGDGRLTVLNGDGTLRWSMQLITDGRNDLNSSPALGTASVYIGGESGEIFSVPLDWCLRPEAAGDGRCKLGPKEDLPSDGAFLYFTTPLGSVVTDPPAAIDANQALAFSLFVRASDDNQLALIDESSLQITTTPPSEVEVQISGNRRFLTLVPKTAWPSASGSLQLQISGTFLDNPVRDGLLFTGGTAAGTFAFDHTFQVQKGAGAFPYAVPSAPGDPSGTMEMYRISVPLPTILPSYNQIGFDSLHYLIGMVEGSADKQIAWVVGAMLAQGSNDTVLDPSTQVLFPFEMRTGDGLVTMTNDAGFMVNAMNADIPFSAFRVAARLDNGVFAPIPSVHVLTHCNEIPTYGSFLAALGFCNPSSDALAVFGSAMLRDHGVAQAPSGLGTVSFQAKAAGIFTDASAKATLVGSTLKLSEHAVSILLIDASSGAPIALNYGLSTQRTASAQGNLESAVVTIPAGKVPSAARAYLMIDTYPAARADLTW
ncbi:MAG: PQQ-like beta-propeller repeat protein [Deltaproteobacteria bacterium]|nr:PQQ-like beta-propeller repeat protein [Deltaproteobacteria bacterium]